MYFMFAFAASNGFLIFMDLDLDNAGKGAIGRD